MRRALFSATIFLTACGFAGSLAGGRVAAQSATDESQLRDSMKQFTDVYALVEANYANKLNQDQVDKAIYDGAIPGMLHVLDPHSNFYDPKSYAEMREEQSGKYYGVGMRIVLRERQGGGGGADGRDAGVSGGDPAGRRDPVGRWKVDRPHGYGGRGCPAEGTARNACGGDDDARGVGEAAGVRPDAR